MKNLVIGFVVCFFTVVAVTALADPNWFSSNRAVNMTRAPIFVAGAAEEITSTTAASDATTQLNNESVYSIVCDEAAYVRWGGTAPTAASGDFKLPAATILFFGTGGKDKILFAAARNITTNGSCWVLEAR